MIIWHFGYLLDAVEFIGVDKSLIEKILRSGDEILGLEGEGGREWESESEGDQEGIWWSYYHSIIYDTTIEVGKNISNWSEINQEKDTVIRIIFSTNNKTT